MLESELEVQLSGWLMKIIEGERSVEYLRNRVCDYPDFVPQRVFENLAYRNSGVLIPKDFKDFLGQKSSEFENEDFYLLVRQYSSGLNGRLSFDDFTQLVLPSTKLYTRDLVLKRYVYRESKSYEISLKLLIEKELTLQREIENIKAKLKSNSGFSIRKAFLSFDRDEKGYIREADITDFARRFGRYINEEELDCFLRRVDTQDDGIITFEEFLDALLPLNSTSFSPQQSPQKSVNRQEIKPSSKEIVKELDLKSEDEKLLQVSANELDQLEEERKEEDNPTSEDGILSPKFKDEKEFTMGDMHNFETPEKATDNSIRESAPKTLYSDIDLGLELSKFLAVQLLSERRIELSRQNLAMMKEFDARRFFQLIDKKGEGEIVMGDLEEFLKEIELEPSNEDFWVLFKRFGDGDVEMKLTVELLIDIVNPSDPEYQFMTADKEE